MVRLADIPPDMLKKIEQFVKEYKRVYPVTSRPKEDGTTIKTMVDAVELQAVPFSNLCTTKR